MHSRTVTVSSFQDTQVLWSQPQYLASWTHTAPETGQELPSSTAQGCCTATPAHGWQLLGQPGWTLSALGSTQEDHTAAHTLQHLWGSPMAHPKHKLLGKQLPHRAGQAFWEGTGAEGALGLCGAGCAVGMCSGDVQRLCRSAALAGLLCQTR